MKIAAPSPAQATRTPGVINPADKPARLARLREIVEHAAHLLPSQGPITVFVHHNTLHAFEDLPFDEAVGQAARLYGCQPYLFEDRYRRELANGRIQAGDLNAMLQKELGDSADLSVAGLATRFELRLAMLQHPLRQGPDAELHWLVAETNALRRFREDVPANLRKRTIECTRHWVMRDLRNGRSENLEVQSHSEVRRVRETLAGLLKHYGESSIEQWSEAAWEALTLQALWRACHQGVHGLPRSSGPAAPLLRHRDLLLEATGEDSDLLVHDVLIRFCAAFLDQGFSHWRLPDRDRGFYQAFLALYGSAGGPPDRWLHGMRQDLQSLDRTGTGPLESIEESLRVLGVDEPEQEPFLSATLLALRGWAGMIWQMETRADRAVAPAPPGTLTEYLAVRLIWSGTHWLTWQRTRWDSTARCKRYARRPGEPSHGGRQAVWNSGRSSRFNWHRSWAGRPRICSVSPNRPGPGWSRKSRRFLAWSVAEFFMRPTNGATTFRRSTRCRYIAGRGPRRVRGLGFSCSAASMIARSRSGGIWKRLRPTWKPSERRASTAWPCTTGARLTPTSLLCAQSSCGRSTGWSRTSRWCLKASTGGVPERGGCSERHRTGFIRGAARSPAAYSPRCSARWRLLR